MLEDDVDAVSAAILTCEAPDLGQVRLVRVRNTLHLDELLVSESLVAEVEEAGYEPSGTIRLFGTAGLLTDW